MLVAVADVEVKVLLGAVEVGTEVELLPFWYLAGRARAGVRSGRRTATEVRNCIIACESNRIIEAELSKTVKNEDCK